MPEATLAILNASVYTLSSKLPRAEAVAVQEGTIITVGSNVEIRKYICSQTKILDAKGRMVIPGLVDCHVHMTGFGQFWKILDLKTTASIGEIQRKLKEYARENPDQNWVLGKSWDQERISEKRYPTRWDLDAAIADKPVFITRVCGHIGVANSKALELANITKETAVEGGKVDMDATTGEPNGVLQENALKLVWKAAPRSRDLESTCRQAFKMAVEAGLTCVHWLLASAEEMRCLQKLHLEGQLPLRVYLGIPVEFLDELVSLGLLTNFGNDMIKIGFVKILVDGSLGGWTAALKEPYSDKPETKGVMRYTQKQLETIVLKAHKAGFQLAVHAIGDHTIETVLKALQKALSKYPCESHRHRIEHCSVLNPRLIRRMKYLGLIASIQPHFAVSDFWIVDRLGKKRSRWVYPFKSLINEGLIVVSGSDFPVEPIDPILGIWATVARKNFPKEKLRVEEALKTYTVNAAYASFDDAKRGTIEAGKFADITILSADLFKVKPEKIKDVKVEMTIIDGKVVYSRE